MNNNGTSLAITAHLSDRHWGDKRCFSEIGSLVMDYMREYGEGGAVQIHLPHYLEISSHDLRTVLNSCDFHMRMREITYITEIREQVNFNR
ncbi:hypothetical protein HYU14_06565 [Candidatus Woesearchaeota archaeon]|nr:hypothetical protein [Candidatus Woesearchaeota archaeon]